MSLRFSLFLCPWIVFLLGFVPVSAASPPHLAVTNVRRVFHNGEHNAFTDLIEWQGRYEAKKLARQLVEDGAGIGSVRHRLKKIGVPAGIANDIAVRAVRRHKQVEIPLKVIAVLGIVIFFGPVIIMVVLTALEILWQLF